MSEFMIAIQTKNVNKFNSIIELIKKMSKEDQIKYINIQDKDNYTALHYSIVALNPHLVKLFIELGGDVNIQDKFGNTALLTLFTLAYRVKCDENYYTLAEMLIKITDLSIVNNEGLNALKLINFIKKWFFHEVSKKKQIIKKFSRYEIKIIDDIIDLFKQL